MNRIERFWSKVDKKGEEECWIWKACDDGRDGRGYGRFCVNGYMDYAHRVAYRLTHGKINEGKIIMHSCDNPKCCNPKHLIEGTDADNVYDMLRKGRYGYSGNIGEKNGRAILKREQVEKIRILYKTTKYNHRELGIMFGVERTTITGIINKKIWKD